MNDAAIIEQQNMIEEHTAETKRLAGHRPQPSRKARAMWHNPNPGPEVEAFAESVKGTDDPILWRAFLRGGQIFDKEASREAEAIIFRATLPAIVDVIRPQIEACGDLMMDVEFGPHANPVHPFNRDMSEYARIVRELVPEINVSHFPNPHHKVQMQSDFIPILNACNAVDAACHTKSGDSLVEFAALINDVAPGKPVNAGIWIFKDAPDGSPPSPGANWYWQTQSGGSWINEMAIRDRCKSILAVFDKPDIIVRGQGLFCAQVLEIVREEVMA